MRILNKLILLILISSLLIACSNNEDIIKSPQVSEGETIIDEEIMKIEVIINDTSYSASLYDNDTAREFYDLLPMTIRMSELNGNEKYYYLDNSLSTDAYRAHNIRSGDIKLFGSDCLVLFYESFSTSYSYSDIGRIDEPIDLKDNLGNSSIEVSFIK